MLILLKKNKIIPNSINNYTKPAFEFSKADLATINKLTKGITTDEAFLIAREFILIRKEKSSFVMQLHFK
jgi:hypothetical protein